MNSNTVQLEAPRWPGGPGICPYENLPALETEKACSAFVEKNCPSCSVYYKWKCRKCDHYHLLIAPVSPSGASNGDPRPFKVIIPLHVMEAFKATGQQVKSQPEADDSTVVFFPVFFDSIADKNEQQAAEQLMMTSKFFGQKFKWEAPQRWRILPVAKGFRGGKT